MQIVSDLEETLNFKTFLSPCFDTVFSIVMCNYVMYIMLVLLCCDSGCVQYYLVHAAAEAFLLPRAMKMNSCDCFELRIPTPDHELLSRNISQPAKQFKVYHKIDQSYGVCIRMHAGNQARQ